ncbi:NDP-hexose 2,3-dehydratase family protein [Propionibacterium acidifaciens]|uniref:NDP-hexose 2,3-dehydratase family protein n=1 Tax=Propionibacterium acidifaciens TaxID=556499 RepID=UPI0012DEBD4F|nr:NDP-hexose 2,3-dehydratase family protein [Propionibacterium acidifaciens]
MKFIKTISELKTICNHQREIIPTSTTLIDLRQLRKWHLSAKGAIEHETGRFFQIMGAEAMTSPVTTGPRRHPMVYQPEIGMLCLFLTRTDDELHGLIVFKYEPGTPQGIEVAPSFQATKSNYERVHGGYVVPGHAIVFSNQMPIIADALQREQEAWFLGKVNRNRVITVSTHLAEKINYEIPNSFWVPLHTLIAGLLIDNLINMDLRSILSMVAIENTIGCFHAPERARLSADAIRSRLGDPVIIRQRSLLDLPGWTLNSSLESYHCPSARIIGRRIHMATREVPEWDQPFLSPSAVACCTLIARRDESGRSWEVALVPRCRLGSTRGWTLEATIQNHYDPPEGVHGSSEEYLGGLKSAGQHVVTVQHAEEGGRFYHAQTRYRLIFVERNHHTFVPGHWHWIHLDVVHELIARGDCVSVEARTCIAMLAAFILSQESNYK